MKVFSFTQEYDQNHYFSRVLLTDDVVMDAINEMLMLEGKWEWVCWQHVIVRAMWNTNMTCFSKCIFRSKFVEDISRLEDSADLDSV